MTNPASFHEIVAAVLPRIFLGILFLAQGYDKAFRVRIKGVVDAFEYPADMHNISRGYLYLTAWFTTIIELFGGVCLILGLFRYPVMYLIGIDLLMATVSFSYIKPIWDLKHIFPRLLLLLLLLLMPPSWDVFSLDYLFFRQ